MAKLKTNVHRILDFLQSHYTTGNRQINNVLLPVSPLYLVVLGSLWRLRTPFLSYVGRSFPPAWTSLFKGRLGQRLGIGGEAQTWRRVPRELLLLLPERSPAEVLWTSGHEAFRTLSSMITHSTHWKGYISYWSWELLLVPLVELEGVARERKIPDNGPHKLVFNNKLIRNSSKGVGWLAIINKSSLVALVAQSVSSLVLWSCCILVTVAINTMYIEQRKWIIKGRISFLIYIYIYDVCMICGDTCSTTTAEDI